ncbi:hypothetical protein ACTQXP_03375 [Holdemanella porci]|uniref:hypothetical protein n=1 Tax=Holdemanella porci TaxID=2652276 RepID=UPI003F8E3137
MKGPIVSIDVSKGKSDYQAFKEMNVKYTGSRSIKHTKEGFDCRLPNYLNMKVNNLITLSEKVIARV